MMKNNDNIALFIGSFDPLTIGHLHVIKEASIIFDKLYVCVGTNINKNKAKFDIKIRQYILDENLKHIPNAKSIVMNLSTIQTCKDIGTRIIIRGLKDNIEFAQEMSRAKILYSSGLHTFWVPTINPEVSSTLIREMIMNEDKSDTMLNAIKHYTGDVTFNILKSLNVI